MAFPNHKPQAEIRPDGKKNKYRLILHAQQEFGGGTHNVHLRNASYAECQERIDLWREHGVCA